MGAIRMRRVLIVALALLASCANPAASGLNLYNQGQYEEAYKRWLPAATRGDIASQNNIGAYLENVRGDTAAAAEWYLRAAQGGLPMAMTNLARIQIRNPQAYDAAISWLNLASRWNEPNAQAMLRNIGRPVPEPDLAIQQQQNANANAAAVGLVVACAVTGTCGGARPTPAPSIMGMPSLTERRAASPPTTQFQTTLCPNGRYVGGSQCHLAPDGTYVGGTPILMPNGRYAAGSGRTVLCPNGTYVYGRTCGLAPDGTYVGVP